MSILHECLLSFVRFGITRIRNHITTSGFLISDKRKDQTFLSWNVQFSWYHTYHYQILILVPEYLCGLRNVPHQSRIKYYNFLRDSHFALHHLQRLNLLKPNISTYIIWHKTSTIFTTEYGYEYSHEVVDASVDRNEMVHRWIHGQILYICILIASLLKIYN